MVNIKDLKNRPIDEPDRPWIYWSQALGLQAASLAITFGAIAIPFDSPYRPVRMGLRLVSIAGAIASVAKLREIDYLSKYWAYREVMREDDFLETQAMQLQGYSVTQSQHQPQPQLMSFGVAAPMTPDSNEVLRDFDVTQFLEEVTGVAILGNSGSGKTAFAQYLAGHIGETQILVLDPHADPDHPHYPWGNLTVISDKGKILEQLESLLNDLDRKDKTPLVIICDEYPAVRMYAKKINSSVADEFILRYGSEARKFKKLPIFMSQSGNVKALGLDGLGDFLENFALCRLQKIAIKYLKNHRNQDLYRIALQLPYSILVNDEYICLHPTHGQYTSVKKEQPPINLKPLKSLPLTINLVSDIDQHHSNVTTSQQHHSNTDPLCDETQQQWLESLYSLDCEGLATSQQHSNSNNSQQQNSVTLCPYCGNSNTKYHNKKLGRRYCNNCNKTYQVN